MATAKEPGTPTSQDPRTTISQGPGTPSSQMVGTSTSKGIGTTTSQGSGTPTSHGLGTTTSQQLETSTSLGLGTTTSHVTGNPTSQEPRHNLSLVSGVIKQERLKFLLMTTLNELASPLMKEIYNHTAGQRNTGESLEDVIMRTTGFSIEEYEVKFSPALRNLITSDPTMDSFDITAWYTILQEGCASLAPQNDREWLTPGTLENNLKYIKDLRNDLAHSETSISEEEFYKKLEWQRTLLVNTSLLAKSKLSLDEGVVSRIICRYHSRINDIRDKQFEKIDWTSPGATCLINIFKSEGNLELKDVLKSSSVVNPASLIAGRYLPMEVTEIFTPLKIVDEKGGNTGVTVYVDDILKVAHSKDADIILLEGIAGVGKTTIIKKIISDWNRRGTTNEVGRYDFIIPLQCRDRFYNSVSKIVSALMPVTRKKFYEDNHMMTCLLGCKTLFILDGIDEITVESEAILTELLEMIERKNIIILMTTRPEKIREIYQMIPSSNVKVIHLRIDGVAEIDKEDFIIKYHTKLKDLGVSTQCNANGLLTYLQTTGVRLQDQWALPLNLTLVTLLWGIDDDRILSITCPVELSIAIRDASLVRLEERVVHKIRYSLAIFHLKMKGFLSVLSEVALSGVRDSDLLIPYDKIQKLRQSCEIFNLPLEELFGGFLVQKHTWASSYVYTFPHKSGQEYYAATHIYIRVFDNQLNKQKMAYSFLSRLDEASASSREVVELLNEDKSKGNTVSEVLSKVNSKVVNPPSMDKYQNTLISLLGILHYNKAIPTQESADEIIKLLRATGVTRREHWIMVLNSVKCDPMIAKTLIRTVSNIMGYGYIPIKDNEVFAFATLLEHMKPRIVDVRIEGNPSDILRLEELLSHFMDGNVTFGVLELNYPFRHPEAESRFRSCINALLKKCAIDTDYTGQFPSGGDLLNGLEKVEYLHVSLQSPEDANSLFTFLRRREKLQKPLMWLRINVGNFITAGVLQNIPQGAVRKNYSFLEIFIPEVNEEEGGEGGRGSKAVMDILRKLNPPEFQRDFSRLCFPRYQSTGTSQGGGSPWKGIERLLRSFEGVWKVSEEVNFPSRCRPSDYSEVIKLQDDCKRILHCRDGIKWGNSDGSIYDMDSWEKKEQSE